ncbi:hypothetical protein ACFYZ9_32400 [Streptomyces sp. NPDC001691]|uniref:hypothetical protein n=1 Tax=Streptomyces sp. NPDC001691 TaxID=3364600 RepID=UPI0036B0A7AF
MKTPGHIPSDATAAVRSRRFTTLWTMTTGAVGAALLIGSLVLITGAFLTDSAAGESWQPAGTLGAVGLCLGATMVSVGVLGRSLGTKSGLR